MFLLIWDVDFYLYDLRIVRYISFAQALVFDAAYMMLFLLDAYMLILVDEWAAGNGVIGNAFAVTIMSYCLIEFAPTFYVNAEIAGKEFTMNQLAWSKQ
jgi:hypothetical protein